MVNDRRDELRPARCAKCGGTGDVETGRGNYGGRPVMVRTECPRCAGLGFVRVPAPAGAGKPSVSVSGV